MAVLQNAGDAAKGDQRGRRGGNRGGGDTNIFKIVKMLELKRIKMFALSVKQF